MSHFSARPLRRLMVIGAAALALTLSACSSGSGNGDTSASASKGGSVSASSTSGADLPVTFKTPSKPYKILVSNNYVGNSWRLQMQKEAQVAAQAAPFKGIAQVQVVTSQNTVQAQVQDLQSMIAQHPDAIIIDAGSPTALNPTIAQACSAGIVVVSFDQLVTAPCAWKIGTDFSAAETILAEWLVSVLGQKGDIAVDRGLPGTPVGEDMLKAGLAVYAKYPGIKVVSQFNGQYAFGPEKQGVQAALASHPDLVGATTDNWGSSALSAFQDAQAKKAAIVGWGPMGALVECAKAHAKNPDINCIFGTNGPSLSINALQLAVSVLQKQVQGKARTFNTDEVIYTTKVIPIPGHPEAKLTQIELGKNALETIPPETGIPFSTAFAQIDPSAVAPGGSS